MFFKPPRYTMTHSHPAAPTATASASANHPSPYAHTVATACAGWGAAPASTQGLGRASTWARLALAWQAWRRQARLAQEDRALHALSAATRRDLGLTETRYDPKDNDRAWW
jgi:hypothetical protein